MVEDIYFDGALGHDTLAGGAGADILDGGKGYDSYKVTDEERSTA